MGHHICAIIGKAPIDEAKLKHYQLALAYENDFAILLLDQDAMYYWAAQLNMGLDSESEDIDWACELAFFFAKAIGWVTYAIIQTDYFGGAGSQCASLYQEGKAMVKEKSINEILRLLGVKAKSGMDEFDTLHLSNYRDSEYYYWEEDNRAAGKANMIAGRILK